MHDLEIGDDQPDVDGEDNGGSIDSKNIDLNMITPLVRRRKAAQQPQHQEDSIDARDADSMAYLQDQSIDQDPNKTASPILKANQSQSLSKDQKHVIISDEQLIKQAIDEDEEAARSGLKSALNIQDPDSS